MFESLACVFQDHEWSHKRSSLRQQCIACWSGYCESHCWSLRDNYGVVVGEKEFKNFGFSCFSEFLSLTLIQFTIVESTVVLRTSVFYFSASLLFCPIAAGYHIGILILNFYFSIINLPFEEQLAMMNCANTSRQCRSIVPLIFVTNFLFPTISINNPVYMIHTG